MRLPVPGHRGLLLPLLPLLLLVPLLAPPPRCAAESATCLAVYREGGAPAVFQSARCPRWTLPPPGGGEGDGGGGGGRSSPMGCHVAADRGRRRAQEDRAVCALGIRIPFLEQMRIKEVDVGVVAIFDGHNGAEASEMASKLFLDYFLLHVYFLLDGIYSMIFRKSTGELTYKEVAILNNVFSLHSDDQSKHRERSCWTSPAILDRSFHMEILKESLTRAVHDIDLTFSKEASQKHFESGSTATVVLIADGQIIAANVGDSKAFLCSEGHDPHHRNRKRRRKRNSIDHEEFALANYDGPLYHARELTKDHHPDREDERSRVEAAGGYVVEWAGVYRVNGELALSRAIGDLPFKRYGVISTPELTGWQFLSENDTFLVASSDGIFEKMTMQDVCDLMLHAKLHVNQDLGSSAITQNNLADYVLRVALQKGTTDNVAAVVVPLGSPSSTGTTLEDWSQFEENLKTSISPVQNIPYQLKPADDGTSSAVIDMDYFRRSSTKFQRFLVEAKFKTLGCFYLSESLDEDVDYIFRVPEAYQREETHDFNHMPAETALYSDGNLEKYKDRHFCLYLGHEDGEMGRCNGPEAVANFFGLLDSLPHNGSQSNGSHSFGNKIDFRYKLKRRFDRGSYGEVWLAFHWNCSEDIDLHKEPRHFTTIPKSDSYNCTNSNTMPSDEDRVSDTVDGDLFILKRIMVERGNAAYLSGLREKYFGELFSNATRTLEGLSMMESSSNIFSMNMPPDPDILLERNMSVTEESLKHVARFIESFESESREIWLVYQNEGRSLSKLIYTAEETKLVTGNNNERVRHIQVLHPSKWWHWLRTTKAGQNQMQNLLWQLLMGLKACHDRNITHRDIKPENMIICFEDVDTGKCLREVPSQAKQNKLNISEQTFEYTPPEALLNSNWFQGSKSARLKYDIWSVGVVMLELIVGSPHVFQISDRTRVLMDQRLEGWSEQTKELAYKLRSYMELCILVPGTSTQHGSVSSEQGQFGLASWKCSEESFAHQVKIRDPLKMGFPNLRALRLARQLLVWHPEDRLSVDEALNHPYFQEPP
ncbi:unnamed protein product [Urochloa decumbens]|uniref:protein-serine/threonine phosphatase n=1 Tax=Urochloa decumbens TaxID=240449 RepID=A0ABC9AN09_9POAL